MPSRNQRLKAAMEPAARSDGVGARCITRPEERPAQPREGPLTKEEKRPKLPLKRTGGLIDVGLASAAVTHLRRLLEEHPREFQALVAVADGRQEEVSRATLAMLHKAGYVRKDGSPLPVVAEVLLAAYRPDTPDGPCVVDALDLGGSEDAATVARLEKKREDRARKGPRRLLRDLSRQEGDEDRGRG